MLFTFLNNGSSNNITVLMIASVHRDSTMLRLWIKQCECSATLNVTVSYEGLSHI